MLIFMLLDNFFIIFDLGIVTLTLYRLVLIGTFFIYVLSHLNRNKLYMHKQVKNIMCFFVFWGFYILFSFLWTDNYYNTAKGLYNFIFNLMLIYIVIKLMNNIKNLLSLSTMIYFITIFMVLLGLVEILTGFHLPTSRYNDPEVIYDNVVYLGVATGTFYNQNDFSVFLSICFPFVFMYFFNGRRFSKIITGISLLLLLLIIIENDARLVLIAIVFQILLFIFLSNITIVRKITFSTLIAVVLVILLLTNPQLIESYKEIHQDIIQGSGSTIVRINLILNGLIMLYESYFLGVGVDNFTENVNPLIYTGNIVDPHNWWIEILAEHGLIIFIGYIYIYIYILKSLYKIANKKHELSKIAGAILSSLVGMVITSIAPSSFFFFKPMWLFIGIALAVINVYLKQRNSCLTSQTNN